MCDDVHSLMMLGPIVKRLGSRKLVLASGSPRRRDILQHVVSRRLYTLALNDRPSPQGIPVEVVPSRFEEALDKQMFREPCQYALANAEGKAREVSERLKVHVANSVDCDVVVDRQGRFFVVRGYRSRYHCCEY